MYIYTCIYFYNIFISIHLSVYIYIYISISIYVLRQIQIYTCEDSISSACSAVVTPGYNPLLATADTTG